ENNWWTPKLWLAETTLGTDSAGNEKARKVLLDLEAEMKRRGAKPFQTAGMYQLIGRSYLYQNKPNEALQYFNKCEQWMADHPDPQFIPQFRADNQVFKDAATAAKKTLKV